MKAPRKDILSSIAAFVFVSLLFYGGGRGESKAGDVSLAAGTVRPQFSDVLEKGCLSCHEGIEDINPLMTAANVNCVTCHLGNPLGTTEEEAHRGMYVNPSDLAIIDKTCGQCHADKSPYPITPAISRGKKNHVGRVKKSLMATCAGIISATRYLFGEQKEKGALFGLRAILDEDGTVPRERGATPGLAALPPDHASSADNLLRHQCLQCHLYTEGLPLKGRHVGGGCAACHMLYADDGLSRSGDPTISKDSPGHPVKHEITNKIPSSQCLHCHNGGPGRIIGLGYIGEMPAEPAYGSSERDYRYGTPTFKTKPDLHYRAGMECIDCHSSDDLHGDGNIYGKMEDQVAIRCETCHGTPGNFPTLQDERGEPLSNVAKRGGAVMLTQKVSGRVIEIPQLARMSREGSLPVAMGILPHTTAQPGKNPLECYSCHVKKAVQCYGCHLKADDRLYSPVDWVEGISEHTVQEPSPGVWSGSAGYIRWEHPALGINGKGKVSPYIPGCQVFFTRIDTQGRTLSLNRVIRTAGINQAGMRLPGWSMNPIQPHTVSKEARSCESCHTIEKSLGLGLSPGASAAVASSGLSMLVPLERMVDEKGMQLQEVSHPGARPFNEHELELTSRFNLCLSCHKDMAYPDLWGKITEAFGRAATNKDHEHILNNILMKSTQ